MARPEPNAFPACFRSLKQFQEWRKAARVAKEECSPCTDCSARYRAEMEEENLCDKPLVRSTFVVSSGPFIEYLHERSQEIANGFAPS